MSDVREGPHDAAPEEDPEACIGQEVPDPWGANTAPSGLRPEQVRPDEAPPPDWPLWFGGAGGATGGDR